LNALQGLQERGNDASFMVGAKMAVLPLVANQSQSIDFLIEQPKHFLFSFFATVK
jgi:hypothetical protein